MEGFSLLIQLPIVFTVGERSFCQSPSDNFTFLSFSLAGLVDIMQADVHRNEGSTCARDLRVRSIYNLSTGLWSSGSTHTNSGGGGGGVELIIFPQWSEKESLRMCQRAIHNLAEKLKLRSHKKTVKVY